MADTKKVVRLGDLLLDSGKITLDQLDNALLIQKTTKQRLGEILVEKGYISENEILTTLSNQMGIDKINLNEQVIDNRVANLISESIARKFIIIPIRLDENKLTVAMQDPLNIFVIDDIEMITGFKVVPVLTTKQSILNAIDRYYGKQSAEKAIEEFARDNTANENLEVDEELDINVNNAPVVRLVDTIIRQALKMGASDIHIEPFENIVRIRYRIDGKLQEMMTPSKSTHSAIVTRIKILAGLNIAERRVPQDGRVEMKVDTYEIDLRISILPTVYGEKVVIRILDRTNSLKSKKELGFTDENLELFDKILASSNGIVLLTGPTGSGKTTTLYTALNTLNSETDNIITVEDPVEYRLDGINQVQVNVKAGLTFASGLRSILRQDPDIIMIGEIRDDETAEIAVRAAITGHLVISTLHTNDAPSAVVRLVDMGIQPYLLASALRGVIAQRLVRKICPYCKEEYRATESEKALIRVNDGIVMLHKGKGCEKCHNTGYLGRIAIHEVMKINSEIRDVIQSNGTTDDVRNAALASGLKTLSDNCRQLILDGITTVDEYINTVYNID